VGGLTFDKDDAQALDFVTAASNLRATIFGIPRQSRWDVKEIAGNIIPAIATTNAIIAGYIVLEALKVLAGRADDCKYAVCNRHLCGRKRDLLLNNTKLDPPNPDCYVCGRAQLTLRLDTTKWTVQALIEAIVQKHLSFNAPTIDYTTLAGSGDQLCEGIADAIDEEDARRFAGFLPLTLSGLPVPIASGTKLDVEDTSQDLKIVIAIEHAQLTDDEAPTGFILSGDAKPTASGDAAAANAAADAPTAAGGKRSLDSSTAATADAKKARADDDGAICLD